MNKSFFASAALLAASLIAVLASAGPESPTQEPYSVAETQLHVCTSPTGSHGGAYCSARHRHFVCQCFRDVCRWGQTYRTC